MELKYEGNNVDLGKFFKTFKKYKLLNLLIILSFILLGLLYYLLSTKKYETYFTVQIKDIPAELRRDLFGNMVSTASTADIESEKDIVQSDFILAKSLLSVGKEVRYFNEDGLKKFEFYKNAPFTIENLRVKNRKIYGKKIEIDDLGERFRLHIKSSIIGKLLKREKLEDFSKIYRYGEPVSTKDVEFIVQKRRNFKGEKDSFILSSIEALVKDSKKNLKVTTASKDSQVLKVIYQDNIARRAKDFLDAMLHNYLNFSTKVESKEKLKQLSFVDNKLGDIQKELERSEENLARFKSSHNISDIATQKEELVRRIGELKNQLIELEGAYESIHRINREINKGNYSIISALGGDYPVLNTLIENIEELKTRRDELLANYTTKHPEVVSITRSISNIKRSIKSVAKGIESTVLHRKNITQSSLNEAQQKLKEMPILDKDLVRHRRVFEVKNNIYNYLLEKKSELSIENAALSTNKVVLDYPRLKHEAANFKLPFVLLFSTLLGMIAAFLHTVFRVRTQKEVENENDIRVLSSLPILSTLPYVSATQESLNLIRNPNSALSEAFRVLREKLNYIKIANESKVVLISSIDRYAGKSVIAAGLASAIGMSGKKCVVLSMDFRNPTLHKKFGLPNKRGVSELLLKDAPLETVLWVHNKYKNLNIITSGTKPLYPAEVVASHKVEEIIEALRKEFEYIIIDTPPVALYADTLSLFKYADISLFVVRSSLSQKESIAALEDMVKELRIENSYIILNAKAEQLNHTKKSLSFNRTNLLRA